VCNKIYRKINEPFMLRVELGIAVCDVTMDLFQVLLNQNEISGEELDFILNNYPPQTPITHLLEEENPGSLPFVKQEIEHDLEYALLTPSKGET
jgi:hypothetical protein